MVMTDPIADLLTRVRNASRAGKDIVEAPASKVKVGIAGILKEEGFIDNFEVVENDGKPNLRINLKYGPSREKVILGIKRISKPGLRVYAKKDEVPRVLGGLGVAVISTPKGLLTGKQAIKQGLGGEVICYVW